MSIRGPGDAPTFTELQGQYLAFIYTPPSVHRMVKELEAKGLIRRQPRTARSIEILVPPEELPLLL